MVTPSPDPARVIEEIQRIAKEKLDLAVPVTEQTRLVADLGLDSLALTILAVDLEDRFRLALREEDAQRLETVGDLVRLLVARLAQEGAR